MTSRRRVASACVVLLLVFFLDACSARNRETAAAPVMVTVGVKVTNNLNFGVEALAEHSGQVVWRESIGPRSTREASIGPIASDSRLALRATDSRGTVVSTRTDIGVSAKVLTWIIP
jgi:hypothetical protein